VNKRKDEVYRKLVDEYTTVENAPFGNTKYHNTIVKLSSFDDGF
jgi:Fe-S-cluster formation regulator IscX/YfhJ